MDGLCGLAKDYFVNLFTASPTISSAVCFTYGKYVSRENISLISPFSSKEFELTVKQMHPTLIRLQGQMVLIQLL